MTRHACSVKISAAVVAENSPLGTFYFEYSEKNWLVKQKLEVVAVVFCISFKLALLVTPAYLIGNCVHVFTLAQRFTVHKNR